MAYSGFKGIGPNGLGTSKAEPKTVNADGPSTFSRPQFKTAQDQKNINSMQAISPAKQMGTDPGETAAFEESKRIELAAEEKMERAKGNKKKQAEIVAKTNKKMGKKVPKAKAKGNKEGYTPFGESKKIPAKSPAKKNGMKYDIKEASNQNLSAKARKNYAENAQHDSKKGYR